MPQFFLLQKYPETYHNPFTRSAVQWSPAALTINGEELLVLRVGTGPDAVQRQVCGYAERLVALRGRNLYGCCFKISLTRKYVFGESS